MKERLKFGVAAALLSPKLAFEDVLRFCKVDVPEKGIFYNQEGQSIMDIWKESKSVKPSTSDWQ